MLRDHTCQDYNKGESTVAEKRSGEGMTQVLMSNDQICMRVRGFLRVKLVDCVDGKTSSPQLQLPGNPRGLLAHTQTPCIFNVPIPAFSLTGAEPPATVDETRLLNLEEAEVADIG